MAQWVIVAIFFVILHGCTFTNADTDSSDASALRVMYSSLNSPGQLTKWNSSEGNDPCGESWKGITCSGNRVTEIQLSGLGLSGSIGYQLASLTSLTNFDISDNNLGNQIPYQLPPNVQRLNLAGNDFTGSLPYSISQMKSLQYLNVSDNQIQGELSDMFGSLSSLNTLDISSNSMTGKLPQSFQSLSSLKKIYLQNNQFTGNMDVLANLPLDDLDTGNNQFTGGVPDKLKEIMQSPDSNSPSSGPSPPSPPGSHHTSPPNSHAASPPSSHTTNRSTGSHKSGENGSHSSHEGDSDSSKKSSISSGGVAGIVVSLSVVGAVAVIFAVKKSRKRSSTDIEKLDAQPFAHHAHEVHEMKLNQASSTTTGTKEVETPALGPLKPPPRDPHKSFDGNDITAKPVIPPKKTNTAEINAVKYSLADLKMATDNFRVENLIGEGSIGSVYRARFSDGKVLTVKKINSTEAQNPEDFLSMVRDISRLHHTNVTELVGYCSEHEEHLLVYEFQKNGSLHDFLHKKDSTLLTWDTRIKISLGTARALEYLHEVCSPSIVHKNIKSENILLDAELNPHLSDSGLAKLIADTDQGLNHNAESGYGAPETAMSGKCTPKSDVYSFGVVMLELFSGRKPFDSSRPRCEQSLVRWATPQLHDIDALEKMVDPAVEGQYSIKSLSRFADVIALCVQPEPEFRPPMSEVVQALVRLVQRANLSKRTYAED